MTDSVDSRALITARSRPLRGSLCKHLVALAWKEWRDQRRMVIAGVSTVIVVPVMLIASGAVTGSSSTSVDILRITRFTLVALVSPLLAAALGTVAVASERRNSVFAFVLSPPLSRSRVWGVKLCVASLCYLAVMLTASLVVSTSDLLSGATPSSLVAGILSGEMPTDRLLPVYAVGAPILMLGMAMMFATYLSSVVAAAAATVASAGVLLVLVSIYWTRLDFVTALDVPTLALELAAGSAAALLISWRRFRRGDLPQLSARRGAGAGVVCCLVVALAVCLVGLPTLWAHTRLPLERAVFSQFEIVRFPVRLIAFLWVGFATLALALASIGLYGLVSYAQARRTREVGIRMSLGADSRSVVALLVRSGMKLVAIGSAIGLVLALVMGRVLSGLLYGVGSSDPVALTGVVLLLLAVAFVAAWVPARRASRVDPVQALRSE